METVTYTAPDISCEHCRTTIERTLGALPGVAAVHVDVPTKRVEVRYDPAVVGEERLVFVLDDEGYPVASPR